MEEHCSPISLLYCYPDEGVDELRHTLLCTTLELESTLIAAKEEIAKRELELIQLKDVLSRAIKERDEAHVKCHKLSLENLFLQQQLQEHQHQQQQKKEVQAAPISGISSSCSEDETKQSSGTESERSTVVSPKSPAQVLDSLPVPQAALKLAACRPLPEQGKLLQAVQEAGPLLQNLLLAGPLPQWQHPPPQLSTIDIPPVAISSPGLPQLVQQESFSSPSGLLCKKRGLELAGDSDNSINSKYQRIVL